MCMCVRACVHVCQCVCVCVHACFCVCVFVFFGTFICDKHRFFCNMHPCLCTDPSIGPLSIQPNLDTLARVQRCVVEALEAGILRAEAFARECAADAAGGGGSGLAGEGLSSNPMSMAASAVGAAGRAVVTAGGREAEGGAEGGKGRRRLALRFVGEVHAVDVVLVTTRRRAVFPVRAHCTHTIMCKCRESVRVCVRERGRE